MAESLFDRENWPEFSHITNPFSRRGKVQRSHGAALCDALVNDFRFNCQTACRHRASGQSRAQAKRSRIPRVLVPAARSARVLSNITLNEQRGQGMPDAWPHPQPRVKTKTTHEFSHHRLAETFRHSLRDGFTVSSALFPVIGLSCHRRLRINVRKLCISVEMPEPRVIARSLGNEAIHLSIYKVLDCFACARNDGRPSRSLSPKKKARRGSPGKPGEDGSGQA